MLGPGRIGVALALFVASGASLVFGGLAPFLLPLGFVVWLSLPADRSGPGAPAVGAARVLVLTAMAVSLVALVRFLAESGVSGIVEAGGRAVATAGLSRQRELLFLEDRARVGAFVDPDQDGIGSALRVDELLGRAPLRNGRRLDAPLVQAREAEVVTSSIGPALRIGGFLYVVCLPLVRGGVGAQATDAVDEELAERAYLLYGWPAVAADEVSPAFVLDQDERILVTDGPKPAFVGTSSPPRCDAAMDAAGRFLEQGGVGARGVSWSVWKKKRPRTHRPGDRP